MDGLLDDSPIGYCTRSYIQSRMRKRMETLTEAIDDAKLRGNDVKRRQQVRESSKRRSMRLLKAKKLRRGFKAVVDKIKRLRLMRIRVKGLARFSGHCQCFAVPKMTMAQRNEHCKYHKLE
ncbi:hypothetical protein GUJ93_ZPchr0004g38916 [Zizania palustris]|uniref:Uncharacterized protein n=1 Tax=Zizania palustris TaxID=103762 RepID=A0A8J5S1A8_ZIZPA|nr:hypothetical protein GUJ93_ZPchr0004g38916 [Zizania palustris]